MISTICFALSTLCLAALIPRRRTPEVMPKGYTYYLQNDAPQPTWRRKREPETRPMSRIA